MSHQQKVHLISLGCARNRVDAEVMLGSLLQRGWALSDQVDGSDAVIVNTCGFIGAAKEESVDTILEVAEIKKKQQQMKLVVSGCLTQRYKNQLAKGLPEVDFFVGTDEFKRLPELLSQPPEKGAIFAKRTNYLYDGDLPKLNTLTKRSAYVKVAEGCQHQCAFCIIPAIRGKLRSRPIENVVKEVRQLVAEGVVEVNLIAQDLAAYGRDHHRDDLLPLLRELVAIDGLEWVRMLYVYPEHITDEFLDFFATQPKLVKYLDIPVQHASDKILRAMKRDIDQQGLRSMIGRVRAKIPGIAIRTTVMAGFPGETEDDFHELLHFVREMKFDHLGCFAYSQEEGTVAARMDDQIEDSIKQDRVRQIMMAQQVCSKQRLGEMVGRQVRVLVEGPSEESEWLIKARMPTQAPEVDGVVLINDGVPSGSFADIEITEAHDYDLVGRLIETRSRVEVVDPVARRQIF